MTVPVPDPATIKAVATEAAKGLVSWFNKRDGGGGKKGNGGGFRLPHRTVIVQEIQTVNPTTWNNGKLGNQEAMQLMGSFFVTNIVGIGVFLVRVLVRKRFALCPRWVPWWCWPLSRPVRVGFALVSVTNPNVRSSRSVRYMLPPWTVTEVSLLCFVTPKMVADGKTFVVDLGFVDQLGNTHWKKKVPFVSWPSEEPSPKRDQPLPPPKAVELHDGERRRVDVSSPTESEGEMRAVLGALP